MARITNETIIASSNFSFQTTATNVMETAILENNTPRGVLIVGSEKGTMISNKPDPIVFEIRPQYSESFGSLTPPLNRQQRRKLERESKKTK